MKIIGNIEINKQLRGKIISKKLADKLEIAHKTLSPIKYNGQKVIVTRFDGYQDYTGDVLEIDIEMRITP